jgi:hypothetical protein
MKPLRRRNGNQHMHRESLDYRNNVKRKLNAYHAVIQSGIVAQGLLQYLAASIPQPQWRTTESCAGARTPDAVTTSHPTNAAIASSSAALRCGC